MKQKIDIFNVSASSLGAWEQCPQKWAYVYYFKAKPKETSQRALKIGIAMHELIETYYACYDEHKWKKKWLINNWPKFYEKHMPESDKLLDDIPEGIEALHNLYNILEERDWLRKPMYINGKSGIEYFFKFDFNGHKKFVVNITGKIDLLLNRNKEICVIDWKTGKSKNFQASSLYDSVQLILYSAALKKIADIDQEKLFLVYFYVNTVKEFEIENDHFKFLKEQVNNFISTFAKKVFKRKRGFHCKYCEFEHLCEKREITYL